MDLTCLEDALWCRTENSAKLSAVKAPEQFQNRLNVPCSPKEKPRDAESCLEPRFDLRTDSSPEDYPSSKLHPHVGKKPKPVLNCGTKAGHQLRRIACAKPHQDSSASY
ncbi:hypothetical protein MHYP_G00309230 [Metynnis hypsauchen]